MRIQRETAWSCIRHRRQLPVMKPVVSAFALAAFAALAAIGSGCLHNKVVEVHLSRSSSSAMLRDQAPLRAVVVIPDSFSSFVFVHHDSNWLRTFRIHAGDYVSARLLSYCDESFSSVSASSTIPEVDAPFDLILIPEFGPFTYSTPTLHAFRDAQVSVSLRLVVLDSTRRVRETISAQGFGVGVFGAGGSNTDELARRALDEALDQLYLAVERATRSWPNAPN